MKNSKTKYVPEAVVRVESGFYVSGFSRTHQCVQLTGDAKKAKTFTSMLVAQRFVDTHADAGYGLKYAGTEIIQVPA